MFKKGDNSGVKNINYKDGASIILWQKLLDSNNCELCSSPFNLLVHHLDTDKSNNQDSNLKVLCHQCHDIIHQKGYNFHKKKWMLKLSETFISLQGEGLTTGTPSIFIRLYGCSTKCPWCDTIFSREGDDYKEYDYKQIVGLVLDLVRKSSIKNIVITGGEPTEQVIQPLIMICKLLGLRVEVETNGKPKGNGNQFILPKFVDCFNISPKLWSKEKIRTFREDRIRKLLSVNSIFKFVVSTDKDFEVVQKMIKRGVERERVYLMPLTAFDEVKDKEINKKVWNYCVRHNLKFSPRLQTFIWGKKKGI